MRLFVVERRENGRYRIHPIVRRILADADCSVSTCRVSICPSADLPICRPADLPICLVHLHDLCSSGWWNLESGRGEFQVHLN